MSEFWLCGDLNEDLVPLADAAPIDARVQLYSAQVLADTPDGLGKVGDNYYPRLCAHDFFRKIGQPLAFEAPSVKEWSCDARAATDDVLRAIQRVRDAGGAVHAIFLDEPLTADKDNCHAGAAAVADACRREIDAIRAVGIDHVGLIEAYPYLRSPEILALVDAAPFSSLHMDVDHRVFEHYGWWDNLTQLPKDKRDMRKLRDGCAARHIPFGVILTPSEPVDAATFCVAARQWLRQIPDYFGGWPDRLIVQTWQQVPMPHTLPPDPNTLTGLLAYAKTYVKEHP